MSHKITAQHSTAFHYSVIHTNFFRNVFIFYFVSGKWNANLFKPITCEIRSFPHTYTRTYTCTHMLYTYMDRNVLSNSEMWRRRRLQLNTISPHLRTRRRKSHTNTNQRIKKKKKTGFIIV